MKKHKANMSFNQIDEYRDLFIVKHASRGDLTKAGKKLIAFYSVNVLCAGPTWAKDESEAQALRPAAACAEKWKN
eukprot:4392638-Prymnesium_polylepis.1